MLDQLIGYLMDAARWLIILILAFLYPNDFRAWNAKVVGVVRADEIRVERDGKPDTIRLYGIDSPIWWEGPDAVNVILPGKRRGDPLPKERRRLHPSTPQEFGDMAKKYTSERCLGKVVTVQPLPGRIEGHWYRPRFKLHDRYGRIIGIVRVYGEESEPLHKELLRKGLAWWYRPFVPWERGYKRIQDIAREKKLGLWSHPHAVPPWEWQGTWIEKLNPLQKQEGADKKGEESTTKTQKHQDEKK
jgi:endonuclease YncB( thermonuclease family)